jgi:hypothetical protein
MLKDNINIVNLKDNSIIKAITSTLGDTSSIEAKLALREKETLDFIS